MISEHIYKHIPSANAKIGDHLIWSDYINNSNSDENINIEVFKVLKNELIQFYTESANLIFNGNIKTSCKALNDWSEGYLSILSFIYNHISEETP